MPLPSHPHPDSDLDPIPPGPAHYAEQALLGALLLDPDQLPQSAQLLPAHFANASHAAVYAALRTLTPPGPEAHAQAPLWLNPVLATAVTAAPALTASYLHTLISSCPRAQHAGAYARMVRAEHARRTLRRHAQRLAQTVTDPTLPHPVAVVLRQADVLARHLDELAAQFTPHPGSLPRTPQPAPPAPDGSQAALDEERLFLATATAHPHTLQNLRWLQPEDFAEPLHGQLYRCLTALAHRGDPVDPVTVLWEAQHRGLLATGLTPAGLLALTSTPVGSPEHWAEQILQRALLTGAHTTATRIHTFTEDPANTPHQLITGARRALGEFTALRQRWHRAQGNPPAAAPPPGHTPTALPVRTRPALQTKPRSLR
ncbi:DnaB-like helicase N-terminal domain-containing protein [Streptomyces sp. H27-D2]|uniref:DnaB-like helicase N-terminal domain-containing protein n=1 Tax=Streptomyces sp. H27-D2 TaxID=3046304 RepID=UPI002DBACD4B|nr:DnaB-like helicase N-terminal domain-containing protein [Streptomyces sp. H27-D2]MEC4019759.1 DnaB-like helicase N-terminal domain-containing protein [Streptomyces sp. H27-D2]